VLNPEDGLSPEVHREMRRLPDLGAGARMRVMAAVRAASAGPLLTSGRRNGGRAGWISPAVGSVLAAGFLFAVAGLGMDARLSPPPASSNAISTAIRDTLMLVRFAFHSPRAGSVALVGDFNGWRAGELRLRRDAKSGTWAATVAVAKGEHQYAFVIDDTLWAADPSAPTSVRAGRLVSRLEVPTP
jgi:hypothetical protein